MSVNASFELRVDGLDKLTDGLADLADAVVLKTAYDIVADMQQQFIQGKSGRRYGDHVASAPGEAPAVDTGALRNSIAVNHTGDAQAEVTVGAEYAPHLEFGTRKMAARPFMGPAFKRAEDPFRRAVEALFDSAE